MVLTGVLTLLSIRYPGTRTLYEEALRLVRLPSSIPLPGGGSLTYPGLVFSGHLLTLTLDDGTHKRTWTE